VEKIDMSDETETPENETPENVTELKPGASKADLKNAADDFLKANKDTPITDDAGSETESEEAPLTDEQRILALEIELQETKDQFLRMVAEGQNIRKRADKQVADARIYAVEKFAGDLLSVSDNLSRALEALPEDERASLSERGAGLLGGIEMTQKELITVFQRNGVVPIDAQPGDAFDPNVHQAVSNVPSDQPKGTIAMLFQAGWKIGDRTLRAAMVGVSAGA